MSEKKPNRDLIKVFKDISKDDAATAGGKGASLGEMTQAGIPVPPGFVILADSFEQFLKETDLNVEIDSVLEGVKHEEMHTVEHASEKIQALILGAIMPQDIKTAIQTYFTELAAEYVAVRSSATAEDSASAAWAGQLDSFLNTTEATLLLNVQKCWASLFTPRAIFYRFEKGLHETKISVAVVVQKMVESESSGIAFSVHPVTEDRNQLIIEAGWGLGEAIVSGAITPDSYVVEKEPRRIIDKNVATQERGLFRVEGGGNEWKNIPKARGEVQVLSDAQILELSESILKIEDHYDFPCDIEWAHEGGQFYIVQSRPITTLNKARTEISSKDKVTLVKNTDCQIDWAGPFSLFHYSIAAGGYFKNFNKLFGKNLSFVYLSYTNGVASAYLPTSEYEILGLYLAEKSRVDSSYQNWVIDFKKSADDIRELFKSLTPHTFFENIEQVKSAYDIYTARQVATKTASNFLTKETDHHIFEQFELARKYSETLFLDNEKLIVASLEEVVKKTNGKFILKQLMFGTADEVSRIYKGDLFLSAKELENRHQRCGVFSSVDGEIVFSRSSAEEIDAVWSSMGGEDYVQGNSAYPGVVTGICRIIKDYKNADLNEGEILVTGMTDPNFVPLMKKAKAVVTDGGGLLCHAAIVARELKKPCVIGTKFATKTFKDGDLLEVDADNGVVRVLERKNDEKIEFVKSYSRDTTLFMQGLWARGLDQQARAKFGWENPHVPFVAHVVNDGVVEIWEHKKAIKWFLDMLLVKNKKGDEFLAALLAEYKTILLKLKKLHEKKILVSESDTAAYTQLVYDAAFAMTVFFYTGMDERSPESAKDIAVHAREQGDFFADNDVFVRKNIASAAHISEQLAGVVLPDEFGEVPSEPILTERQTSFILIDGSEAFVGSTKRYEEEHPEYHFLKPELDANMSEVSGQVAYKGKVQGVVRIVKKQSDMSRVRAGDILVSPMTTPDFLPAMQKAIAFVTDEGGVTCHAAIVSRELKKPCIIGTKIATQVLQDGDLIEVDADNGVVRIIEKA